MTNKKGREEGDGREGRVRKMKGEERGMERVRVRRGRETGGTCMENAKGDLDGRMDGKR